MSFRFEEIKSMANSSAFKYEIDLLVKTYPGEELYSLCSQIKRAADSVLNIAEGSTAQTIPEYKRFLGVAPRSAIEVVACLFISHTRKYIDDFNFRKIL